MIFNKRWFSLLLWIFLLICIWIFYHNTPILHIKVESSIKDQSQLFYKKRHLSYQEEFSIKTPLSIGMQTLTFESGSLDRVLRWDPSDHPGTFLVKKVWIEICKVPFNINLNDLLSSNQIDSVVLTPNGLLIKTTANADDPQIQINIPADALSAIHVIRYISTGLMVFLIILLFFSDKRSELAPIKLFQKKNNKFFVFIEKKLKNENYFSLQKFVLLFAITCVFYWYFLSHFYVLIDSEYTAFRVLGPNRGNDWIGQGRWLSYLLEKYVLAQPIVPYVQNFLFCVCITLSYLLITSIYKLKNRALVYFTYPLFCAFPVWLFIVAFYANIASISIGILLVSVAIFIFDFCKDSLCSQNYTRLNWLLLFVQAILLAMAVAAYQVFILVYAVLGLGLILFNLVMASRQETALCKTILNILYLIIIAFVGMGFYFVISKFMLWLVPSDTTYLKGMLDWPNFFKHTAHVVKKVFSEANLYYSGATEKYGASICFSKILILLSIMICFFSLIKRTNKKVVVFCVIFGAVIFLAPFLFNFISRDSLLNTRSLLAIPFVIWLITIMALTLAKFKTRVFIFAMLFILEFQMLQVIGIYAAAIDITGNHDRALAANLYERIGSLSADGCSDTPCVVDVYGLYHITTPYPTAWQSTMGASFFEWDTGNILRMLTFMQLLGYNNLVPQDNLYRINNIALFKKMPVWPAAGSVVKSKDVYLVKLSNTPDPAHEQP